MFTRAVLHRPRRSQAKAGTDARPQRTYFLDADQRLQALPVRIEQDEGGVPHPVSVGKCQPLGGIEVCQNESDLSMKLGAERVNDALQLGAVRSAGQKHLHDRWLLAEDVEATVPWLTGEHDDGRDGGDHHRGGGEQDETSALAALPLSPHLLPRRFPTLAHRGSPATSAPVIGARLLSSRVYPAAHTSASTITQIGHQHRCQRRRVRSP
jgi:hypothetical protein